MGLPDEYDTLALFTGGQFQDGTLEDPTLALFTDGQFGSRISSRISVPTPIYGGGGGSFVGAGLPIYYALPVASDPWIDEPPGQPRVEREFPPEFEFRVAPLERPPVDDGWYDEETPHPDAEDAAETRVRPTRRRLAPAPPAAPRVMSTGLGQAPKAFVPIASKQPAGDGSNWKAIACGAVGVLVGIVIARVFLFPPRRPDADDA